MPEQARGQEVHRGEEATTARGARRGDSEVPASLPHKHPDPRMPALQTHPFAIIPIGPGCTASSLNPLLGSQAEPGGLWRQKGQLRALTVLTHAQLLISGT